MHLKNCLPPVLKAVSFRSANTSGASGGLPRFLGGIVGGIVGCIVGCIVGWITFWGTINTALTKFSEKYWSERKRH